MKYLGLARKYRPKTFEEVVGQKQIADTLQNAIVANRVHHAYLFCGSRGVGKTSMARIFAKALNCVQGPTIKPCNQCEICQRISTGEDVDVIEIDGASNRGIEEIRNIKENIKYLPSRARFKIYIIDEVHMLTIQAFNALLKTLEEPPEHAKFIFATTQIHSIPDTILSRCQKFTFNQILVSDIVERLKQLAKEEGIQVPDTVLEKVVRHSGGAMRDSLVLLDQLASYTGGKIDEAALIQLAGNEGEEATTIIEALAGKNRVKLLEIIHNFVSHGGSIPHLVDQLIQQLRDILVLTVTNESGKWIDGSVEYQKWLETQKACFTPEFLHGSIHRLIEAKGLMSRTLMSRIILETTLLKIVQADSLLSLKKIEESLYSLEERLSKRMPSSPFSTGASAPANVSNPGAVVNPISSSLIAPSVPSVAPRQEEGIPASILIGMKDRPANEQTPASHAVSSIPPSQMAKEQTRQTTKDAQAGKDVHTPVQQAVQMPKEMAVLNGLAPAQPLPQSQTLKGQAVQTPKDQAGKDVHTPVQQAVQMPKEMAVLNGQAPAQPLPQSQTLKDQAVQMPKDQAAKEAQTSAQQTEQAHKEQPFSNVAHPAHSGDKPVYVVSLPAEQFQPAIKRADTGKEKKTAAVDGEESPWRKFLQEMLKYSRVMSEFLQHYARADVNDTVLIITIPRESANIATTLMDPKKKKDILPMLEKSFGKPMTYKFNFEGKEISRHTITDKAILEGSPLVRKAIELFEGRILEVNKISSYQTHTADEEEDQ